MEDREIPLFPRCRRAVRIVGGAADTQHHWIGEVPGVHRVGVPWHARALRRAPCRHRLCCPGRADGDGEAQSQHAYPIPASRPVCRHGSSCSTSGRRTAWSSWVLIRVASPRSQAQEMHSDTPASWTETDPWHCLRGKDRASRRPCGLQSGLEHDSWISGGRKTQKRERR